MNPDLRRAVAAGLAACASDAIRSAGAIAAATSEAAFTSALVACGARHRDGTLSSAHALGEIDRARALLAAGRMIVDAAHAGRALPETILEPRRAADSAYTEISARLTAH